MCYGTARVRDRMLKPKRWLNYLSSVYREFEMTLKGSIWLAFVGLVLVCMGACSFVQQGLEKDIDKSFEEVQMQLGMLANDSSLDPKLSTKIIEYEKQNDFSNGEAFLRTELTKYKKPVDSRGKLARYLLQYQIGRMEMFQAKNG